MFVRRVAAENLLHSLTESIVRFKLDINRWECEWPFVIEKNNEIVHFFLIYPIIRKMQIHWFYVWIKILGDRRISDCEVGSRLLS